MNTEKSPYGLLAEYDCAQALYKASERIRDKGFQNWDAMTPFPVHGLENAMGLKPSKLPWVVLLMGSAGAISMLLFVYWIAVVELPLNIGGKPLFSLPAFIPVIFEITILFSALTAVFGMFVFNKMPTYNHPVFQSKRFERVTDDRFFILIETKDPLFDRQQTKAFLEETGAVHLEVLENE